MSLNNKIDLSSLKELAQQQKEEVRGLTSSPQRRININFKLVIMIIVYISSLVVTALKELISSDMEWAYLGTTEFLSNMLFNTINNIFLLLAVFVYFLDKFKKATKEVAELVIQIKTNVKKFISSIFSLFLKNFNRERRKQKYKAMLDLQLNNLEKTAKDVDLICWLRGTEESKKVNKYCIKKQNLLDRMDDVYIEANIDTTYVRLKETTSAFVKYGYTRATEKYSDPWEVENGASKFIRDLGPKILLGIALIFILQALRIEVRVGVAWQEAIFAIILRLYPMGVHTYIGVVYARQFLEEKILVDLGVRFDISEQALEYQNNFLNGKIAVEERNTTEHPVIIYKGVETNG